ncbi:MAG: DUF6090 family protein [Ekhidna sp.]
MNKKITTYLLYAVGEIILVVAGILIAVQIDSGRIENTRKQREQKILKEIQLDLEYNTQHVSDLLRKLKFMEGAADSILKSIKKKKTSKSFSVQASIIHRRFFVGFTSSGYKQLTGPIGIAVQNDSLRKQLIKLHEDYFEQIIQKQNMLNNHLNEQLLPKSNELFEIRPNIEFKIKEFDDDALDFYFPIDLNVLFKDNSFRNTIVNQKRLFEIQKNQLDNTSTVLNNLLLFIEKEIKN